MFEEVETGHWSLSPMKECWSCMKQMRAAVIRREMAQDVPLYLAPVIAAYVADNHETTRTQLGAVTIPMSTTEISTISSTPEGE